jgi:hypothetical protein
MTFYARCHSLIEVPKAPTYARVAKSSRLIDQSIHSLDDLHRELLYHSNIQTRLGLSGPGTGWSFGLFFQARLADSNEAADPTIESTDN